MAKVKIGTPPNGLAGEQLAAWYADAYEDAYERALFDHREARRQAEAATEALKAQIEELKGQLPGDEDVLLAGDDAKRWQKLQEVDLDELRAKAQEGERVVRHAFLRDAAEAIGYNPKTFTELVELRKLQVDAKTTDGKTEYMVQVETDGKTKAVPIVEHFEQAFADWLPALQVQDPLTRSLGTPPTGRLRNDPPPRRKPEDFQQQLLQRAQAEAMRSKSVLARALVRDDGGQD